jgi:methyl-accepting chemotaxis protein
VLFPFKIEDRRPPGRGLRCLDRAAAGHCGYSALSSSRLAHDLEATATIDLTRVQLAYQLEQQAGLIARASRELLLVDGAGQIKKQRELIKKNLADADATFAKLTELGTAGDSRASR